MAAETLPPFRRWLPDVFFSRRPGRADVIAPSPPSNLYYALASSRIYRICGHCALCVVDVSFRQLAAVDTGARRLSTHKSAIQWQTACFCPLVGLPVLSVDQHVSACSLPRVVL